MSSLITPEDRIYVAGHPGMAGSAICRALQRGGYNQIFTANRAELDLLDGGTVERWFAEHQPTVVVLAAAKVGGIAANSAYPADFLLDNLKIQTHVIETGWRSGVRRLLFLGSSCIYPKFAAQPIREEALLTGALEPTNEWYAVAKIAGIKLCQAYRQQYGCDFISAMPTNLYGPEDNFDLTSSHVLPALIRKFHDAKQSAGKEVEIWGTGSAMREFLHVDDLADACLFLMENYSDEMHINVGTGVDLSIRDLAEKIRQVVYPAAELRFDTSKPDGTPRKVLDVTRLKNLGWSPSYSLDSGLASTYQWFLDQRDSHTAMRGMK